MKCPICATDFTPKRSDAKTCGSPACRKKLQRQTSLTETSDTTEPTELVDDVSTDALEAKVYTSMAEKLKDKLPPLEFISTGIPELDELTKFPRRRITEIYGLEGVGKTSLALNLIAGMSREGLKVLYIDTEAALDALRLDALNPNSANIEVIAEGMIEDVYELVIEAIKSKQYDAVIVDSIAGMSFRSEIEGDATDANMGIKAKILNKLMRIVPPLLQDSRTALILINQLRPTVGMAFGPAHYTPGGWGIKYAASLRIELSTTKASRFVKNGQVAGHVVKALITKSKVCLPWQSTEFKLVYNS